MKIDFHLLRDIVAVILFAAFFLFPQHLKLVLFCSFALSIIVLTTEKHTINQIIRDNLFPSFCVSIVGAVIYFLTKVYATHYFNDEYGIFTENLNYSVQAWAGIVGTIYLILALCIMLIIHFSVQMIKTPTKELKGWVKVAKFAVYSFACAYIYIWLISAFNLIYNHDKAFLRLDAYQHSDCRTPENQVAIRKDDETCYAFNLTGFLEWELNPTHQPKKTQKRNDSNNAE